MDVISLTTIPSRMSRTEPCIKSLEKQGLPVHIYIPRYWKRKDQRVQESDIPDFMKDCNIHLVEDEGSVTKLRPALRSRKFDRVITADDDMQYPDGWAEDLLAYSDVDSHKVFCYRGRLMKTRNMYRKNRVIEKVGKPRKVNFITGVKGVVYRTEFFSRRFIDSTEFTTVDDVDISTELNRNNIEILVIPIQGSIVDLSYRKKDCLAMQNVRGRKNEKALRDKGYWKVTKPM